MTEQIRTNRRIYWLWFAAGTVLLDQLTKAWVRDALSLYERVEVTSWFNLVRLHNTGAAFSFLSDAGGWQQWLFILLGLAVTIGVMVWLRKYPETRRWDAIALSLLVGGALGNVIDRVAFGYVTDFADFHLASCLSFLDKILPGCHWPAFNVADMAISIAAVMLIVSAIWPPEELLESENADLNKVPDQSTDA